MAETDRVLGVIPARGGSKGVPRKNLAVLGGVSLVARAVRQAAAAARLTRTVVSTEDPEIARAARAAGGDVPFLRPDELARDDTPTLPVLLHALDQVEAEDGVAYGLVVILQPTSPLRTAADIDGAIEKALATGADSVVTVGPAPHPAKIKRIEDDRLVPYAVAEPEGARRQDLGAPAVMRNGAVYVIRSEVLRSGHLWGDVCRPHAMPAERSLEIDEPSDLHIAKALLDAREKGEA